MGKLTVESIINIYGSGVKEIKTYNEAKRAKTEEFLQVEPVAFSLSDEPDVLRIYIDKESAAACLLFWQFRPGLRLFFPVLRTHKQITG